MGKQVTKKEKAANTNADVPVTVESVPSVEPQTAALVLQHLALCEAELSEPFLAEGLSASVAAVTALRGCSSPWGLVDFLRDTIAQAAEGGDLAAPLAMIEHARSLVVDSGSLDRERASDECCRMRDSVGDPLVRCLWEVAGFACWAHADAHCVEMAASFAAVRIAQNLCAHGGNATAFIEGLNALGAQHRAA
jgi:hypothetical protein